MTLEKLNPIEKAGDWHDKPLRYRVVGPDTEVQKFSTLREARYYMLLRRTAVTQSDAINAFVATCLL
jgi:hypothetical protein